MKKTCNELIIGKKAGNLSTMAKTTSFPSDTRSVIELPSLEGDTQIYLGQTILTMIRLNLENDDCYSKELQHQFKTELFASLLEELNISIDDIALIYKERNTITD